MAKFEYVECDLCGADDYKVRYRKPDDWLWKNLFEYPVVECNSCGLVYVNPRPTKLEMSSYYAKGYHDGRDGISYQQRYKNQSKFLSIQGNEKILDIGCARGDFLKFLKDRFPGLTCVGIDLYSERCSYDEVVFFNKDLLEHSFASSEFEIITAWAVLEHVLEPHKYFEEMYRILKPRGKLIFLVTNADSLYGKRAFTEDVPRHTYHFSEKSLLKYANNCGFKKVKFNYSNIFWDGSGRGTFRFLFENLAGVTWVHRKKNTFNFVQKIFSRVGKALDRVIFMYDWEVKLNRSGIMIVEFCKE